MDEIDKDDIERLSKIMRSMSSSFAGLREAAASRFHATLEALGVNAADLAITVINSEVVCAHEFLSQIEDERKRRRTVDRDNDALRMANQAMLEFIEAHHGRQRRQQFERETVLPEWPEFCELIRTRVFGGKMPKKWQEMVAAQLDTTVARMQRWHDGTTGIPPEVMQVLHDLPPAPESAADRPMADSFGKKIASKSPDMAMKIAELMFSGKSRKDVASELGIDISQTAIEWNAPPRMRIHVPANGPVTWLQIWQMESAILSYRGWKTRALRRLGLPDDLPFTEDPNRAAPDKVQSMRQAYFESAKYKTEQARYAAFERITLREYAKRSSDAKLRWASIFDKMRDEEGWKISHDYSGIFAAKFNKEQFEAFDIHEATANRV